KTRCKDWLNTPTPPTGWYCPYGVTIATRMPSIIRLDGPGRPPLGRRVSHLADARASRRQHKGSYATEDTGCVQVDRERVRPIRTGDMVAPRSRAQRHGPGPKVPAKGAALSPGGVRPRVPTRPAAQQHPRRTDSP